MLKSEWLEVRRRMSEAAEQPRKRFLRLSADNGIGRTVVRYNIYFFPTSCTANVEPHRNYNGL